MHSLLLPHRMSAALVVVLVAAHASAQSTTPGRAAFEPLPGVHVGYERSASDDSTTAPGRLDGSVATPAGTLRTTVRPLQNEERSFERGDTSFDLSKGVLGGRLQLRGLEAGGTATTWRTQLGAGFAAKTQTERSPTRNAAALQLRQDFNDGHSARALLSNSRTATAQGARYDLELAKVNGLSRWSAGIEAAERNYVSSSGEPEARTGMRLDTQWPFLAQSRLQVRYTRQMRWDTDEPVSSVTVGTSFDLPKRASLSTSLERDTDAGPKASVRLTVPLEPR